jgi:hypothetical protein
VYISGAGWESPPKEAAKYADLGACRCRDREAVVAALARYGVEPDVAVVPEHDSPDTLAWLLTWHVPPGWTHEQRQRLDADVRTAQDTGVPSSLDPADEGEA